MRAPAWIPVSSARSSTNSIEASRPCNQPERVWDWPSRKASWKRTVVRSGPTTAQLAARYSPSRFQSPEVKSRWLVLPLSGELLAELLHFRSNHNLAVSLVRMIMKIVLMISLGRVERVLRFHGGYDGLVQDIPLGQLRNHLQVPYPLGIWPVRNQRAII